MVISDWAHQPEAIQRTFLAACSAAYDISCVAAGLLDGYWELALHEWDVCAAELILAEAGGVVCDLRRDRGISIVAGNGAIVKEILKYVR